jgi:hypothetical protein
MAGEPYVSWPIFNENRMIQLASPTDPRQKKARKTPQHNPLLGRLAMGQ